MEKLHSNGMQRTQPTIMAMTWEKAAVVYMPGLIGLSLYLEIKFIKQLKNRQQVNTDILNSNIRMEKHQLDVR